MGDKKTFIHILSGCNHCGLVEEAKTVWNQIKDDGIKFDSFLMAAFIDCFSRSGRIKEAMQIFGEYEQNKKIKDANDSKIWISLLNGCKIAKDEKSANEIYESMQKEQFDEEVMAEAMV